jgi:archaetidylinositol phosphate synthase
MALGLARIGLTPNQVTIIGFLFTALGATFIIEKVLYAGALLIIAGGLFDALDGALARLKGTLSAFGGVLDSVVDRYSDGLIIASVWYALGIPFLVGSLAFVGSLLTSYTRARLEAAGTGSIASIGLLERPERLILLVLAILLPALSLYIFIVVALLSNFTVFQRLSYAHKRLGSQSSGLS